MKILVVDHDPAVREILTLAFERRWPGAKVLVAEDGAGGLRAMQSEYPNLMILEMVLPDIAGVEVLKAARAVSHVPIIMLTSVADKPDMAKALDMGADDYMTKPFSYQVLLARTQAVLRRCFAGDEKSLALAG